MLHFNENNWDKRKFILSRTIVNNYNQQNSTVDSLWTVLRCWCTERSIRTTVGIVWIIAAFIRTPSRTQTSLALLLLDLPWGAVLRLGSTVLGVGAAKPVWLRTAAAGTDGAITLSWPVQLGEVTSKGSGHAEQAGEQHDLHRSARQYFGDKV